MKNLILDPRFRVVTLNSTHNPQRLVRLAMHQDYSADPVADWVYTGSEKHSGEIAVKRLLNGGRGDYGCLEHPQITVNVIGFPHSVLNQARTHRVGISFDAQSFRYTSESILDVATGKRELEDVFYFRPVGQYRDRTGSNYEYTLSMRNRDCNLAYEAAKEYRNKLALGISEEHARDSIPFSIRQHFVVSFNLRSALHFLDLRCKADAQLEIQSMAFLLFNELKAWCPEIVGWYEIQRLGKAKLSP